MSGAVLGICLPNGRGSGSGRGSASGSGTMSEHAPHCEATIEYGLERACLAEGHGRGVEMPKATWCCYGGTTDHTVRTFEPTRMVPGTAARTSRVTTWATAQTICFHLEGCSARSRPVVHLALTCAGISGASLDLAARRRDRVVGEHDLVAFGQAVAPALRRESAGRAGP